MRIASAWPNLHQLRGRVGRGQQKSYCVLISRATGEAAKERLQALTETDNGFVLAEKDLELRGPGDLGTGRAEPLLAQLRDLDEVPREAAQLFAQVDPGQPCLGQIYPAVYSDGSDPRFRTLREVLPETV